LFNIKTLQWDNGALDFLSVGPEYFSEPVPPERRRNNIDLVLADAMNISAGTPVFIGGSDGCLANLGSLCLDASVAAITIGTSAAVRVTLPQPLVDTIRMIFNYLLHKNTFVCGGAVNNGGNILAWLAEKFLAKEGKEEQYEKIFAAVENVPAGSRGLIFLPYLHGERAPIWDEKSCGVFFGITSFHDRDFFARAAMEGVCFALKEILTSIELLSGTIGQLRISGAVSASDVMLQMLADVTGKVVSVQEGSDASATGAAYLALKELGAINAYADLPVSDKKIIQPDTNSMTVYQNQFAIYQTLYPALKEAMHSLHQLTAC
jgi:gluconokinase